MTHPNPGLRVVFSKRRRRKDRRLLDRIRALIGMGKLGLELDRARAASSAWWCAFVGGGGAGLGLSS